MKVDVTKDILPTMGKMKYPDNCLRVSEIIGCKLALWFKATNTKKLPKHPITKVGTELHNAAYNYFIKNELPSFKFKDNEHKFKNLITFYASYPFAYKSIMNPSCEERLHSIDFEPMFTGKYDMILDKLLIDFKSAKYYQTKYRLQLSGYAVLCEQNGINVKGFAVLLLGNYSPQLIYIKPDKDAFMKEYCNAVDVITKEISEPPKPEYSYICQFCSWIDSCRKINGVE